MSLDHFPSRLICAAFLCAFFTACTDFPELENTVDPQIEKQPFPELAPQSSLIAIANDFQIEDEDEERRALNERRDGLGARADALRTP